MLTRASLISPTVKWDFNNDLEAVGKIVQEHIRFIIYIVMTQIMVNGLGKM